CPRSRRAAPGRRGEPGCERRGGRRHRGTVRVANQRHAAAQLTAPTRKRTKPMTDLIRGTFPSLMKDPFADAWTQPFWDAAAEGRLVAPRCTTCGTFVLPPQPFCFTC